MIDNIKKNENQHNEVIGNDPRFDNTFSLSSGTKDTLPLVTVSLRGDKKQSETMVSDLTCLWDTRDTDRIIKINIPKNMNEGCSLMN